MKKYLLVLPATLALLFLFLSPSPDVRADTADAAAIKQAALDYIEGWYEGNGDRMERALHPDLAKRVVSTDPNTKRSRLNQMSALGLLQFTKAGDGKGTPKDRQRKDVTILDQTSGAASVKIVAGSWIDYLHIAKFNGKWVIVNVLWEPTSP